MHDPGCTVSDEPHLRDHHATDTKYGLAFCKSSISTFLNWSFFSGATDKADGKESQGIPAVAQAEGNGSHQVEETGAALEIASTVCECLKYSMPASAGPSRGSKGFCCPLKTIKILRKSHVKRQSRCVSNASLPHNLQGIKAAVHVQRLEALQAKQQAVLKRKSEEAEAARKRLKARPPVPLVPAAINKTLLPSFFFA